MKKKVVIVAIALALVVSLLFSGCSKKSNASVKPSTPTGTSAPVDVKSFSDITIPDGYDFGGRVFKVYHYFDGVGGEDDVSQRWRYQLQLIQQKTNATVDWVLLSSTNDAEVVAAAGAGSPIADFGMAFPHLLPGQLNAGSVVALDPYFNDLKWTSNTWDQKADNAMAVKGKHYIIYPAERDIWRYHNAGCLFMNLNLLQNSGVDPQSIYDLQANKQWTWDKFKEDAMKVTKDLDGDGIMDQYGLSTAGVDIALYENCMLDELAFSNNSPVIVKDPTGQGADKFNTAAGLVTTLNFIKELGDKGAARVDTDYGMAKSDFIAGKIGFHFETVQRSWTDFKDMTDNFGIVAPPIGPDATDYRIMVPGGQSYVMFSNNKNEKQIAQFMYIFNQPLYTDASENAQFITNAQNFLRDTGSEAFINMCKQGGDRIDTSASRWYHLPEFYDNVYSVYSGAMTAQQLLETKKDAVQAQIDNFYNPVPTASAS